MRYKNDLLNLIHRYRRRQREKSLACQYHNRHQRAARKMHHLNCGEEILHFMPTQKYKANTLNENNRNMASLDQNEASSDRICHRDPVKTPC